MTNKKVTYADYLDFRHDFDILKEANGDLRLGQAFCHRFKIDDPELVYSLDHKTSELLIVKYLLMKNQYTSENDNQISNKVDSLSAVSVYTPITYPKFSAASFNSY